ncbi:MAG: hypothetical protein P8P98_00740, partial [Emcibacteraceae bacterium]|nr:hypothetical protein [Emcibacteraceae bacterium]
MIRLLVFSWVFFTIIVGNVLGQEDDYPEMALLPQGEGREEVFYLCSACHSIKTVVQQKLSRDAWDKTLDYMVAEQGMPELDTEDRVKILNYLST